MVTAQAVHKVVSWQALLVWFQSYTSVSLCRILSASYSLSNNLCVALEESYIQRSSSFNLQDLLFELGAARDRWNTYVHIKWTHLRQERCSRKGTTCLPLRSCSNINPVAFPPSNCPYLALNCMRSSEADMLSHSPHCFAVNTQRINCFLFSCPRSAGRSEASNRSGPWSWWVICSQRTNTCQQRKSPPPI